MLLHNTYILVFSRSIHINHYFIKTLMPSGILKIVAFFPAFILSQHSI